MNSLRPTLRSRLSLRFLILCLAPGLVIASAVRLSAQAAPNSSAASVAPAAPVASDAVVLTPFTVNTDKDNGFSATNAGTATKLGLDMKDMAAAYSVMTGEFLEALGLTNMQDAVLWSTNASPVIDGQGADQFNLPVMFNVRGAGQNVGQQRNFFTTASISDTYNTERIDFGRGPNAVLFNTGASDVLGGGISSSTKRARFDRDSETIAFTAGSWEYYRTTLDVNRKLTPKLSYGTNYAIRGAATYDLYGLDAKPENGFGYDGALTFALLRDSALGGIAITPRYYFNRREFRLGAPPTTTPINNLMGRNDATDGTANSRNQLGFTDVLGQDYFATLNKGYEIEFSGRITRGWRLTGNLGTALAKDYDRWKNTQAYVSGRADEFRQVLERAGGRLDTTQKNPGSASAPGLAIANPTLTDAAITAAGGSASERANAVLDYNNIWVQFDSIPLIADTVGVKKLSWKILTDYTVQEGRLKGLRFGIGANFTDLNLAGYRSADTVANPSYDKSRPVAANNLPYMDDPGVDLNTPIWFKQPFELTGTLGYSMRLRSGWRVLQGKEISFNFIVRNMMNWQKVIRQDTGLALRAPNGDLSLPYRVAVPSRIGSYQRPINCEFTTTLKL